MEPNEATGRAEGVWVMGGSGGGTARSGEGGSEGSRGAAVVGRAGGGGKVEVDAIGEALTGDDARAGRGTRSWRFGCFWGT